MDKSDNLTDASLSHQITRDYKIVRLLGKGGMGDVFLAEQLLVGRRPVALKVLNRSCCEDPDLKRRFENEAASAGRIHHPNVVMVYECRVTDDGQLYVAMEYVEGLDLGNTIEERGALPLDEIVEIVKQAAAGLGAAHRLGIVHRDVKPANIMLNRDEDGTLVVKVVDFGIARLSEPDSSGALTKTGVIMGTPYYMSPEQALGRTGDKIDRRSDVYSLAMVVYQMLTGRVAFESDSWMQVMYKHINEAPLPPSQVRPELAGIGPVEEVVLKGLDKDRDKRQQSAAEFANELQAAYARLKSESPQQFQTLRYQGSGPAKGAATLPAKPVDKTAPARSAEPMSDAADSSTVVATPTVAEPRGAETRLAGSATNKTSREGPTSFETTVAGAPPKPALPHTVQAPRAAPVTGSGSKPPALKRMAAVVAAVIALGALVVAIIAIRGPGTSPESAGGGPVAVGPQGRRGATGRNPAESKDEAKKETAASKPGEEEPARPGRNPRENSPREHNRSENGRAQRAEYAWKWL